MQDLDRIINHFVDCLTGSRKENGWAFVRKDIIADAIYELKFYRDHGHDVCVNCPYDEDKHEYWKKKCAECELSEAEKLTECQLCRMR